jgi:hypothetical protein
MRAIRLSETFPIGSVGLDHGDIFSALRLAGLDPFLPFKFGPTTGRNAHSTGRSPDRVANWVYGPPLFQS